MDKYLRDYYEDEITNLMNLPNDREHLSIHVDMCHLQQKDKDLYELILCDALRECAKWDEALLGVQKFISEERDAFLEPDYQIKVNCHVRFMHLLESDARFKQSFPTGEQIDEFVEIRGNVVRMGQAKLLEMRREYECSKCSETILIEADYVRLYTFDPPKSCPRQTCAGFMHAKHEQPQPKHCVDYQEIKIQEPTGNSNMPKSLLVTLENDLVSTCQPGDCVTVCGTIKRRWHSYLADRPCILSIALRAVSLTHEQKRMNIDAKQMMEQMVLMQMEWNETVSQMGELRVRDLIVKSICPEIYGMYPVKLAIALVVCSGGIENTTTATSYGLSHRGQSHLLLVGDPGLAKSRLLLNAVAFAPRAIHTTGMGCSSAGLTAAAVKEDGEWQLEAGALVLADGGICCIDEFNLMRPTDRASIHEAMEQQTISMAKAGMVCKLSTRCAILAAANPKNLFTMSDPGGTSSLNIGIDSPLLSRFDLVLILRDDRNVEWDTRIADHLLGLSSNRPQVEQRDDELWTIQNLQAHFVAIRNINPEMSEEANAMLGAYYKRCRSDPQRDQARTTVRLLDSLTRLAKAHARLLFRNRVNASDAAMVIRLMESTFGFGRILQPFDVITEKLPLGPDTPAISGVYRALNLGEYQPSVEPVGTQIPNNGTQAIINERTVSSQISVRGRSPSEPPSEPCPIELDEILNFDFDEALGSQPVFGEEGVLSNVESGVERTPLTLSNEASSQFDEDNMDVDDVMLSQALDQVEQSASNSQHSQQQDICAQRPQPEHRLNLSTFAPPKINAMPLLKSQQPTTSTGALNISSTTETNLPERPIKPTCVRNRLLLTQSDGSDDDDSNNSSRRETSDVSNIAENSKRKVSTQTIRKLNVFQNPNAITANASNAAQSVKDSDDSAYDSIVVSQATAADNSGIVPSIVAIDSAENSNKRDSDSENHEDLSFLEDFPFDS